jgi:hypothetical protein
VERLPYKFDFIRFIVLLITFLIFFSLFFVGGFGGFGGSTFRVTPGIAELMILVVTVLALVGSFVRVEPSKDDVDIITESRCPSCGFVYQRRFVNGDYITKQDQPCPKDQTPTVIHKIYVQSQQK